MKKMDKVRQEQINSDYEWLLMQNLLEYSGEWIAISERKIIARDKSLKKTMEKVKSLKLKTAPYSSKYLRGSITT